jgi:hypothetical protein
MRFGALNVALALVLAASILIARARWFWCLTVFIPATLAAIGFLQASRRTCVSRAAEGTFEHEDFSTTPAPEDDVVLSREVASRITRDSMLIGVAAVVLAIVVTRLR